MRLLLTPCSRLRKTRWSLCCLLILFEYALLSLLALTTKRDYTLALVKARIWTDGLVTTASTVPLLDSDDDAECDHVYLIAFPPILSQFRLLCPSLPSFRLPIESDSYMFLATNSVYEREMRLYRRYDTRYISSTFILYHSCQTCRIVRGCDKARLYILTRLWCQNLDRFLRSIWTLLGPCY